MQIDFIYTKVAIVSQYLNSISENLKKSLFQNIIISNKNFENIFELKRKTNFIKINFIHNKYKFQSSSLISNLINKSQFFSIFFRHCMHKRRQRGISKANQLTIQKNLIENKPADALSALPVRILIIIIIIGANQIVAKPTATSASEQRGRAQANDQRSALEEIQPIGDRVRRERVQRLHDVPELVPAGQIAERPKARQSQRHQGGLCRRRRSYQPHLRHHVPERLCAHRTAARAATHPQLLPQFQYESIRYPV